MGVGNSLVFEYSGYWGYTQIGFQFDFDVVGLDIFFRDLTMGELGLVESFSNGIVRDGYEQYGIFVGFSLAVSSIEVGIEIELALYNTIGMTSYELYDVYDNAGSPVSLTIDLYPLIAVVIDGVLDISLYNTMYLDISYGNFYNVLRMYVDLLMVEKMTLTVLFLIDFENQSDKVVWFEDELGNENALNLEWAADFTVYRIVAGLNFAYELDLGISMTPYISMAMDFKNLIYGIPVAAEYIIKFGVVLGVGPDALLEIPFSVAITNYGGENGCLYGAGAYVYYWDNIFAGGSYLRAVMRYWGGSNYNILKIWINLGIEYHF